MIFFVAPSGETWELEDYLKSYGKELLARASVLTWDQIVARQELGLGSYVFLAIDQMSPTEKEIAAQCWEKLSQARSDITLINHPSTVLLRYDLLQTCYERKRNAFRVRRGLDFLRCDKFPVFLRREHDHNASISGLLSTRKELVRAIARGLYLGFRLRDLIIVEYCDTADGAGMFRKYSSFIVGDRVLPHTLMHSDQWITKSHGRLVDAATAREELEYVQKNPHGEWVRETFSLANIRYGRIDYGLLDGKPQVWEINTNPTIVRRPEAGPIPEQQRRMRDPVRQVFFPSLQSALEAIDSVADPSQTVPIEISQSQRRKLDDEKRQRVRVQAKRTFISRRAGPVFRSLRRLLS
ncbi:MAG TPA: hypothetical protein VN788_09890 [Verrucomicrobiae bacterium]|nr:hypothetical protein [Verrucomicrobiae bacterium]